jgi:hypothetical protein
MNAVQPQSATDGMSAMGRVLPIATGSNRPKAEITVKVGPPDVKECVFNYFYNAKLILELNL